MTREEFYKITRENLPSMKEILYIAYEFNEWLGNMSEKYKWDKDDVQFLIKQFLMCEVEE